jgi:hypothetical protein
LAEQVAPFLEPGEAVQGVIPALVSSSTLRTERPGKYSMGVAIVATERRYLLFQWRTWLAWKPKVSKVIGTYPRSTKIGWGPDPWFKTSAFGPVLFIRQQYVDDAMALDRLARESADPPSAPQADSPAEGSSGDPGPPKPYNPIS